MVRAPANDSSREATALWWTLVALLLASAALAAAPWMGLWGLGVQRFLSPLEGWLPWTVAALACVPALARAAASALGRWGEALEARPAPVLLIAAAAAAALVWLLPDRVRWVGDSMIRLGGVKIERAPELLSPQALPLDAWLHYHLPRWLVARHWLDPDAALRAIGAAEAAVWAALAAAFALALETTAAGRAAAMAAVFFGGTLCLMTGESKAFAEIGLAVIATGALGMRVRGGRSGLLALGAVVAAALLAHRLALGLLPAFLLAWITAFRRDRRVASALLSLALPAVALLVLAGRLKRTLVTYDLPQNFLPANGGGLGPLLAPTRLLDLVSALVMLSPLMPVIPLLWPRTETRGRGARAAGEPTTAESASSWTFLLVLAAPFLLAAFLARPPQGLIRDWDGLAAAGVALSLLAAWEIARALREPRRAWLAVPVTCVAAASALVWLFHYHDPPRAIRRVEALLLEPPPRPPAERSRAWDFLGWHDLRLQRWDAAAQAFDSASALGPTPRMLSQWAMAETMRKNYAQARALYRRAVASDSNYTAGWKGVAVAAIWFEDLEDCERAVRQLQRLAPRDPKTLEILAYLEQARRGPAPAR